MKKMIAMILLLTAALGGCGRTANPAQTQPKLVTGITAEYKSGAVELRRSYSSDQKIRAVLDYLRCLQPYGSADVGALAAGANQAKIVLTYSDGTTKTYDQRGDQFLKEGNGGWKNISAEKGSELPLLLGLMESD